ncbi:MAG: hypothetical protein OEX22_08230 [Cyclobacteriaceae bacterium]|nr:hypothetical protein [Cyclobacteriaceae bacterium]
MIKKLLFLSFWMLSPVLLWSQSTFIPNNKDYYHLVNRYEIKNGKMSESFHSSFRTYKRKNVAAFTDSMEISSKADQFNVAYLKNDNWEWVSNHTNIPRKPFLKYFYRSKSDVYHVQNKNFDLHVNPVLYLSYGTETANSNAPYINTRGIELRAMIDEKVGFYSFIGENQARFPLYVRDNISKNRAVPHEGFWKRFETDAVDFFTIRGYVTFNPTKHIDMQFGHDNFFIGNGYRSLLLSDYAPSFTFLRINTQIWKFKYTNVYGQLTADSFGNASGTFGTGGFPNKYIALHHLSLNVGKKLNLGLFESIIFGKELNNNYELKYLNPVIFYRAIEHQNGSADNALVGLDMKWLVLPKASVYGQLILDEFHLKNLKEGQGWWGNKYGVQAGFHYIDAFAIPNLDIQGEINTVRPYTYSHGTMYNNYAHYRQPLAHPNGANFKEIVGIVRYQPIPKLSVVAKGIYNTYGADSTGTNWGGDVLKDYTTRQQDLNNDTGQGVSNTLLFLDVTLTYQMKHNIFIDVKHVIRKNESEWVVQNQNTSFTSVALRMNISKRLHDF